MDHLHNEPFPGHDSWILHGRREFRIWPWPYGRFGAIHANRGQGARLIDRITREILPAMTSRGGIAGVHLLRPVPPPPMTNEQAIRGPDKPMTWLLLATGYNIEALRQVTETYLAPETLERYGALPGMDIGTYALHYTVTAHEVARTAPHPTLHSGRRPGAAEPKDFESH